MFKKFLKLISSNKHELCPVTAKRITKGGYVDVIYLVEFKCKCCDFKDMSRVMTNLQMKETKTLFSLKRKADMVFYNIS